VFDNGNGSFTSQISGSLHYLDNNNAWQDIDLNITKDNNFAVIYPYYNTTNEIKSYFTSVASNAGVKMNISGVEFKWWQNPSLTVEVNNTVIQTYNPSHTQTNVVVHDDKLHYDNIYPSVMEEFVVLENGIENNTIIKDMAAFGQIPSNANLVFKQFIPLKNDWVVVANGQVKNTNFTASNFSIRTHLVDQNVYFGNIIVFDNSIDKSEALMIEVPQEKRSAAQQLAIQNHVIKVNYSIKFVAGGIEVSAILPASWLKENHRTFPVTIDPVVTITPASAAGNFYGPMTYWYGFQRHADLYLQSEINAYGFITAVEYNSTSAGTAGSKPKKIHMRTTPATTLTGSAAWNSATYTGTGATLCLDASSDQGNTTGWKMFTLTNQFMYSQDNLLVMVYDQWGGSGSSKYYNQSSSVSPSRQAYSRVDNTNPGDGASTTVESRLTEIRITWIPLAPDNNAGVTSLSNPRPTDDFCSNSEQLISVYVTNLGANALLDAQVNWSVNGVLQTPTTLTAPITNYRDSVEVTLGNAFIPTNAPVIIKAWTSLPNGVVDSDHSDDTLTTNITASLTGVVVDLGINDTIICEGTSVNLDAGSHPKNPIYIWSNAQLTQTVNITSAGIYWVKVQNSDGCTASDTVMITAYDNPVLNSIAVMDDGNENFTFNVIGAAHIDNYIWDFGDNTTQSGVGLPTAVNHTYTIPRTYEVVLTVTNQCKSITSNREIIVFGTTDISDIDAMRAAFSVYPNPTSSTATIENKSNVSINQVTIVNVMGQTVHAYKDIGKKNVTINMSNLATGIYSIIIHTDKGNITKKLEVIK
jgi:hypothetical protein